MQAAVKLDSEGRDAYRFTTVDGGTLPLLIEPQDDAGVEPLCGWLGGHSAWIEQQLTERGALLFRGFDVGGPHDFERIARAIDAELKNEYLGTSPRDGLTDYVFSASELPGYYPIPQHCEMSFTANPPRRVFFCCLRAPKPGSGETPLVDFRKVYRDLDPQVRGRFEQRGIRIVRNYGGPEHRSKLDLWKLKRWDEMFMTTDRSVVDRKCREQGFEASWGPRSSLRLISTQLAVRNHPSTGEPVWHNHAQVFHLSAAPGELRRVYELRPTVRAWVLWKLADALVGWNRRSRSSEQQSMHCTHEDGSEIAEADMEAVRDAIWRNIVITPWQRGDVLAIDNHSTAHGRLPYSGPREVAVCWA